MYDFLSSCYIFRGNKRLVKIMSRKVAVLPVMKKTPRGDHGDRQDGRNVTVEGAGESLSTSYISARSPSVLVNDVGAPAAPPPPLSFTASVACLKISQTGKRAIALHTAGPSVILSRCYIRVGRPALLMNLSESLPLSLLFILRLNPLPLPPTPRGFLSLRLSQPSTFSFISPFLFHPLHLRIPLLKPLQTLHL